MTDTPCRVEKQGISRFVSCFLSDGFDRLFIVLGVAFHSAFMDTERVSVVLSSVGSILVIFLLVYVFAWFKDSIESMKMNQALVELQNQASDEGK